MLGSDELTGRVVSSAYIANLQFISTDSGSEFTKMIDGRGPNVDP